MKVGDRLDVLTYDECLARLATEEVGRLAVVVDHYPQIFPVNYRLDDTIVVFRTAIDSPLLESHLHNVGFEVDHLDPVTRTGWSVLVQGMGEDISTRRPDLVSDRAQSLGVEPWVEGPKPRLIRIIPAKITGRRIPAHDGDLGTNSSVEH
jgi:nitroimidazol reductase NimA-like FMN-containing flavoprotein (pyridoxamine 5'-phosphate oxidase superfamily)